MSLEHIVAEVRSQVAAKVPGGAGKNQPDVGIEPRRIKTPPWGVKSARTKPRKKKEGNEVKGELVGSYTKKVYTKQGKDLIENILPSVGISIRVQGTPKRTYAAGRKKTSA